jgi:predicted DNA binding protein
MSLIAEYAVPIDEFVLKETLSKVTGVEAEVEKVVAHSDDQIMPYVWIVADDPDGADAALREDPSVKDVAEINETEDAILYHMDWVENIEVLVHIMVHEDGTVLSAATLDDNWRLRVLFPDRESLSNTHSYAEANSFSLSLTALYEMDNEREGRFGLSNAQHEVLSLATRRGYYDVPRETTLEELADELGVSAQSLSERLRRAQKNLNTNTVIIGEDRSSSGTR